MEGSEKLMLNAKEVIKQWSEFQDEDRAFIINNWAWKAVVMHYYVYFNICKHKCIDDDFDRFVIDHFCEPINNNLNEIITIFFFIVWIDRLVTKFIKRFFH